MARRARNSYRAITGKAVAWATSLVGVHNRSHVPLVVGEGLADGTLDVGLGVVDGEVDWEAGAGVGEVEVEAGIGAVDSDKDEDDDKLSVLGDGTGGLEVGRGGMGPVVELAEAEATKGTSGAGRSGKTLHERS